MPAIHEVLGFKIDIGPLKRDPILGNKIAKYPSPLTIVQEEKRVVFGEGRNGTFAKVQTSEEIELIEFGGSCLGKRRTVLGERINRDPLTRNNYYYQP